MKKPVNAVRRIDKGVYLCHLGRSSGECFYIGRENDPRPYLSKVSGEWEGSCADGWFESEWDAITFYEDHIGPVIRPKPRKVKKKKSAKKQKPVVQVSKEDMYWEPRLE